MPIALRNAVDDDESSEASYRRITPAEFAKLDPNTVTLLDLREPADFAAHPVEGSFNVIAPETRFRLSLRTAPTQRPEEAQEALAAFLESAWAGPWTRPPWPPRTRWKP